MNYPLGSHISFLDQCGCLIRAGIILRSRRMILGLAIRGLDASLGGVRWVAVSVFLVLFI